MKIIISTKNLELAKEFEDFVKEKIGSLEKFTRFLKKEKSFEKGKDILEFFVEIEKETEHHKKGFIFMIKVRVVMPGKILVANSKSENLETAITDVKEELQQEIKKYKSKKTETVIRKQRKFKEL